MLVVRCPQCGAPSPASLAQPGYLFCDSCGYAGAPDAESAQRLQAASQVLQGIDVRARQLTEGQRRALSRARGGGWRLLSFLFMALLPLTPCAMCSVVFLLGQRSSFPLFVVCSSPFLFLAMTGGIVVAWAWRRQRKLEEACAAAPPRVEGQGARCHVCGAELLAPDLAARGIVRCGYCQADNTVDARVLARLGRRRSDAISDVEAAVRDEGSRLGRTTGLATGVVVLLALIAPIACLVSTYVVNQVASDIERPLNYQRRYLLVDTPEGRCLAYINTRYSDGTAHVILGNHGREVRGTNYLAGGAQQSYVRGDWSVGRRVRFLDTSHHAHEGIVLRTHGTLVDRSNHAVVFENGVQLSPKVADLCFLDRPTDPPALPWPEMSMHPRGAEEVL